MLLTPPWGRALFVARRPASGPTWVRFDEGEIDERWDASGTGQAIRDVLEP